MVVVISILYIHYICSFICFFCANILPIFLPIYTANIPANIYTVTIADAANCITIRSFDITDPQNFVFNANLSQNNPPYNLTCFQINDGSIDLTLSGGTQPYLYIWSTGSNNEDQQNLSAGIYTVLIRDSNLCEAIDTFSLTEPPQIFAYAGVDVTVCGRSYFTMNADSPSYGIGHWEILNGNGLTNIVDPTYFASQVDSLQIGVNSFLWVVADANCSVSDETFITVKTNIIAFAGTDKLDLCDSKYTLTGTLDAGYSGFWSVLSGGGAIDSIYDPNSIVTGLTVGSNLLTWTVSLEGCTDSATINVRRLDSLECLSQIDIPSAFSPNGDGHNDYFEIRGIEDYAVNQLTIFDRWGVEVFSKSGYQNNWKGDNNGGNQITDGTYFYLLKVEGISKEYKGFIDVRR